MKMKIPRFVQRQKLRATARRISPRAMEEFEQEPNMSFTKALAVVVVLHVVAVGGIIAFNSIKAHKISSTDPVLRNASAVDAKEDAQSDEKSEASAQKTSGMQALPPNGHVYQVKAGDTLQKIAVAFGVRTETLEEANGLKNIGALRVGQDLKIPEKPMPEAPRQTESAHKTTAQETVKPAVKTTPAIAKDGGEIYTVKKGDNPVAIARKFHVNYDELLKLNKIEDPKKLKIGQKLKIPAKAKKD
jgi:LysM repeat protein